MRSLTKFLEDRIKSLSDYNCAILDVSNMTSSGRGTKIVHITNTIDWYFADDLPRIRSENREKLEMILEFLNEKKPYRISKLSAKSSQEAKYLGDECEGNSKHTYKNLNVETVMGISKYLDTKTAKTLASVSGIFKEGSEYRLTKGCVPIKHLNKVPKSSYRKITKLDYRGNGSDLDLIVNFVNLEKICNFKFNDFVDLALQNDQVEAFKFIIAMEHYRSTENINFAFSIAAEYCYTELVEFLLEDDRVNPSSYSNAAIMRASEDGCVEVVKLLLADSRANPAFRNNYPIRHSSSNGHAKVVELLLNNPRVDPSAKDNYAIRDASFNGHTKVVKLLLADPRVDPSAKDNFAIRFASANGSAGAVKLLLADPRVDPTAMDNYAIRHASTNNHQNVVKLLAADRRIDPFWWRK